MSQNTLEHSHHEETKSLEPTQLKKQFDALVGAETWGESIVVFEEMTEPVLKEVAALDEDISQDEINGDFTEAHEKRIAVLNDKLDKVTEVFMEKPYEAFVTETFHLFELSKGRSEVTINTDSGVQTTEFVTRDPSRIKADVHFKRREKPDGTWEIKVEMPLRGKLHEDMSMPFTITANSSGELTVTQKTYKHYAYHDEVFPHDDEEKDSVGKDRLRRYFRDTLVATGEVYKRPVEEREHADQQAKQFLAKKRTEESPAKSTLSFSHEIW